MWVAVGVAGATLVGSIYSANQQADAAEDASNAQSESAAAGIAEQRRQFDSVRQLLSPFVSVGTQGLTGQQSILGLNGPQAQQAAYDGVQNSPAFASMVQRGEEGILQNASATGGLRGGNVQSALAQFRPSILSALIDQQYSRLGGLTSIGQNAAAGVGNAGMATGTGVAALMQQQGAAQAGGALAAGRAQAQGINGVASALGQFGAMGNFGGVGQGYGLQAQFSQTPAGSAGFGTGAAYGNQDMGMYF